MTRPMSLPAPSPMERHLLDFLAKVERDRQQVIAALETRIVTLEQESASQAAQIADLEARVKDLEAGADALSNSLASFLAPPEWPLPLDG